MKTCTKCGETKASSEFNSHKDTKDKLTTYCKACIREYNRKYREARSDELKRQKAQWYQDNKEQAAARQRAYRQTPRGQEVKRAEAHRNRAAAAARTRKWYRENPERFKANAALRRMRSEFQMSDEDKKLSIAYRKAISNDPCYYCGVYFDKMHDDHMTPLARGGTDHWWNLVRACASCNLRKHDKTAEEFMELTRSTTAPTIHASMRSRTGAGSRATRRARDAKDD